MTKDNCYNFHSVPPLQWRGWTRLGYTHILLCIVLCYLLSLLLFKVWFAVITMSWVKNVGKNTVPQDIMMTVSHTLNIVIYHNGIQYMTEIFCVVHAVSYSKFAYCTTRTANAKRYPMSTHVRTNFHVWCAYVHSTHMCTILLDNQDEFQQNYTFYSA